MQDLKFDIQLFAEGGAEGVSTGADSAPVSTGAAGQSADVTSGANSKVAAYIARAKEYAKLDGRPLVPDAVQPVTPPVANSKSQDAADTKPVQVTEDAAADTPPEETFDSLVGKNGKYEKEYNSRMSAAIKGRLKSVKQAEDKLREFAPLIGRVAENFGVDIDDIYKLDVADLIKRFDEDTRLIADEADANGEDSKLKARVKSLERKSKDEALLSAMDAESERLRQAELEQSQRLDRINEECKALKQLYPTFDLGTELQSDKFKQFLGAGLSIQDAYEATHIRDLMSGGMQYAAKKAEQKVAATIQANKQRPAEAGMSSSSAAPHTIPDFGNMKPSEFKSYVARVKAGERLNF